LRAKGIRLMVWFLVDDNLTFHKKVTTAGNAAMGVWVRAGAWSASNLTDGYIPLNVARKLGGKRDADRLVSCGLWSRVTDGYQFHDWEDLQPTSSQIRDRRERARLRKAKQRQSQDVTPPVTRDSRARARPSPSKDLASNTHQGAAPRRAPSALAAPDWLIEIADCELCDDNGMRKPDLAFRCDHVDRRLTSARGLKNVRQTMGWK